MNRATAAGVFLALILLAGCATTVPPASTPAALSLSTLDQPPFDRAIWAIHVVDDSGRVIASRNAGTLVMPASNRKLFAAFAIAKCLGFDRQLATEIWRDGEDLVLRGDGDPSLGSWRYERQEDFNEIARALRSKGIASIRDLVIDVSAFDRTIIPGGWKHGNLGQDYAAPVDAISWEENEIAGDRSIPSPALHAGAALREALYMHGVTVTGEVRVNETPRQWGERLLVLPSPFVGELLNTVLKNSHNLYTEMLFKRTGEGSYETAFALERAAMTGVGLDPGGFRFVDGSGLAPDNLVTPIVITQLLRVMDGEVRDWWPRLAAPAGDGTLRRRLVPLADRFRGKTGTINGVNALSGIVAMPDGSRRYVSAIVNHHIGDGDVAVRIIDALVLDLAQVPPAPRD